MKVFLLFFCFLLSCGTKNELKTNQKINLENGVEWNEPITKINFLSESEIIAWGGQSIWIENLTTRKKKILLKKGGDAIIQDVSTPINNRIVWVTRVNNQNQEKEKVSLFIDGIDLNKAESWVHLKVPNHYSEPVYDIEGKRKLGCAPFSPAVGAKKIFLDEKENIHLIYQSSGSLKYSIFESSSSREFHKILIPFTEGSLRGDFLFQNEMLEVDSDGNTTLLTYFLGAEKKAIETHHKILFNSDLSPNEMTTIMMQLNSSQVLTDIYPITVDNNTTLLEKALRKNNQIFLLGKAYSRNDSEVYSFLKQFTLKDEKKLAEIFTIPIFSDISIDGEFCILPENRILVSGTSGLEQAKTGSVVKGGRAGMVMFSMSERKILDTLIFSQDTKGRSRSFIIDFPTYHDTHWVLWASGVPLTHDPIEEQANIQIHLNPLSIQ